MTHLELIKLGIILSKIDGGCFFCIKDAVKETNESFDLTNHDMNALVIGLNNPEQYHNFTWNKETKELEEQE